MAEVDPQYARPPSTAVGIDESVIWGPAPPELIDLEVLTLAFKLKFA